LDRINGAGHVNHLFVAENAGTNQPPTEITYTWLNAVQEEIVNVCAAAGVALNPLLNNQLATAIATLISAGSGTVAAASETVAGKVELATAAETTAGTDAVRATHPAGVKSAITAAIAALGTFAGIQSQTYTAFTTAGATGAFTLTPSPAIGAYAANQRFRVKFHAAGNGADTINVSALGVKNIKQYSATGAKVAPVIAATQLVDIEYDGVDFVLLESLPSVNKVNKQVFTGGGVFVIPASDVKITLIGGGGGGGGGGTVSAATSGGNGSASTIASGTQAITTITAGGGTGGASGILGGAGGDGGAATNGSVNTQGGCGGSSSGVPGGGGGAGGAAIAWLAGLTVGNTLSITVGGGGTGGNAGTNSGPAKAGSGGNTIFAGGAKGLDSVGAAGATNTGGGGAGGGGTNFAGGAGGSGIVIFEWV
jgi:hypothetical protein